MAGFGLGANMLGNAENPFFDRSSITAFVGYPLRGERWTLDGLTVSVRRFSCLGLGSWALDRRLDKSNGIYMFIV